MGSPVEVHGWAYGNSRIQHWFAAGSVQSLCRRAYNGVDFRGEEPQNGCSTCVAMLRKRHPEPSTKRTPR